MVSHGGFGAYTPKIDPKKDHSLRSIMTKFDPFWEKIGRISLKIVTSVKFHLIVLRPIGRDITPQAKIVRRMTMCIGLLKGFCYLSIVPRDYDICNYYYRVQHVVINMDKINVINN